MNRRKCMWLKIVAMSMVATWLPSSASAQQGEDPSGTWRWSFTTRSGREIESRLKLRKEGGKLVGVYVGRQDQETPITAAKFDGKQLSFQITRERDGQQFVIKYRGVITGDTIRGELDFSFRDQTRTRPWEAKRDRETANVAGTWKWSRTNQSGQIFESTLRLQQDGNKVTGLYVGRGGNESQIDDVKLQGNELAFDVTRERNGRQFTIHYQGKLTGDTLTGEIEFRFGDQTRTRPWEAKRERETAKFAGTWTSSRTGQSGQTFESVLKLKQDGNTLTGVYVGRSGSETPISEVKLQGTELSFHVTRERNGQQFTSKYHGKLSGDTIQGERESNFRGQTRTRPWEAKRATESE